MTLSEEERDFIIKRAKQLKPGYKGSKRNFLGGIAETVLREQGFSVDPKTIERLLIDKDILPERTPRNPESIKKRKKQVLDIYKKVNGKTLKTKHEILEKMLAHADEHNIRNINPYFAEQTLRGRGILKTGILGHGQYKRGGKRNNIKQELTDDEKRRVERWAEFYGYKVDLIFNVLRLKRGKMSALERYMKKKGYPIHHESSKSLGIRQVTTHIY